jgi:hypothetical protein
VRSYRTQLNNLSRIAAHFHIRLDQQLSEDDLCILVASFAVSHKFTTVGQFVSAIAYHVDQRWPGAALPRGPRWLHFYTGLQNYYGSSNVSQPKLAFTFDDLRAFGQSLLQQPQSFEASRDWCACLLAFFGLLRINEYMNAGLRIGHVRIANDGTVDVTIPYSKTTHHPTIVSLSSRPDELCPARALSSYLQQFPRLQLPMDSNSPLFISRLPSGPTPTSDVEFIDRIRGLIRSIWPARDASRYAGHSFRRGGATALKVAGVADSDIKRQGRWSSDAYRAYFDSDDNPAVRLLATRALLPSP